MVVSILHRIQAFVVDVSLANPIDRITAGCSWMVFGPQQWLSLCHYQKPQESYLT
jgi:hypothetical protein